MRRGRTLLQREIAEHRRAHGERGRYPQELRQRVVRYAAERRAAGATWPQLSEELGVPLATLTYWQSRASEVAFRRVEIGGMQEADEPGVGLSVRTPEGYRIEGLELAQVTELLRALR